MKFPIAISVALFFATHDYFISVCDIEYNVEEKILEVGIQLTTHDLEKATDLQHLGTEKEPEGADDKIFAYVQKHLKTYCDGEIQDLEWVGKKVELEDMWVFVQVSDVEKFGHLTIMNTMLFAQFEEQQNRVNVKVPGHRDQGTVLTADKVSHEFHYH